MISNYKVKVNDSCNYKVSITDIQNKYKFKLFCAGADLTDYYTKEQVDQSQNTQDILIDNILNQIPTGTATGETINITDSSSLPLKDIQVAGNTYQETNANVFNGTLAQTTYTGTGAVVENSPTRFNFINGYTYTINIKFTSNNVSTIDQNRILGIRTYKDIGYTGRGVIINSDNLSSGTGSITFTVEENYNRFNFINYADFQSGTITITDFEIITNTPTPDYPQTITNVTGTNTIKINGKNLFDGILELGNFNSNTGEKVANNNYIINTNPIPVEELTNYKISSNGTGIRMYVFEYKEDMTYNLSTRKTVNDNEYLTTNSGTKYINFRTIDANTNLQEKIQVEKGTTTATTYEPYQSQNYAVNLGDIELCKIGDYKDRIYYSSGKWYLEQKIGKVVLDSSENWATWYQTSNSNIGFYYTMSGLAKIGNESDYNNALKCNRFSEVQTRYDIYIGTAEGIKQCGETGDQYIALGLAKTRLSDWSTNAKAVESLKAWLSSNKPIVYYVLATPTTTEITDTTLIGQLDALLNSTTYKTTTNITVDTTNQKPTLTLTYRKDLETLIGG